MIWDVRRHMRCVSDTEGTVNYVYALVIDWELAVATQGCASGHWESHGGALYFLRDTGRYDIIITRTGGYALT